MAIVRRWWAAVAVPLGSASLRVSVGGFPINFCSVIAGKVSLDLRPPSKGQPTATASRTAPGWWRCA
jgi:hypothetical protein